jgi:hypothetical protein
MAVATGIAAAIGVAADGVVAGDPGPGFGFGPGWGWGGYPYPYYDDYYAVPSCGWARVRVWRNHHWVLRRAWRCW